MNPYAPPEPPLKRRSEGVLWGIFIAGWICGWLLTTYANISGRQRAYDEGIQKGREIGQVEILREIFTDLEIPDQQPYDF